MAFSTKRVYYTGNARDLLPSGHNLQIDAASIGTIDILKQSFSINLPVASIPNSNKVTAVTALNTAIVSAIDTRIGTTMGVDTSGNTVDYNFNVTSIVRGVLANDIFFDNASDVYVIKGALTVAVS